MKKEIDIPSEISELENSKTCFLSNFPPKECGIATFTKNLSSAMDKRFNPILKSKVIAINEDGSFYNYNKKVIMAYINIINGIKIDTYLLLSFFALASSWILKLAAIRLIHARPSMKK